MMKFRNVSSLLLLLCVGTTTAFTPRQVQQQRQFLSSSSSTLLKSTVLRPPTSPLVNNDDDNKDEKEEWIPSPPPMDDPSVAEILERGDENEIMSLLTAESINGRLEAQLNKMKLKDNKAKELKKEDLEIIFEDEHIVAVNKPAGVLCVPGKGQDGPPCFSEFVFENVDGIELPNADRMVVHRLGFDTTGIMVFAKTIQGLRGMNIRFRTREVDRTYEALVVGHIAKDSGRIHLPLMRCLMYPPFVRVSTDDAQCAIIKSELRPDDEDGVGRKYLELPKESMTEYKVLAREELYGLPVTRVELLSLSGRTHQLNVHCAAFGHPIVGDLTYGIDGEAGPHGGLTLEECEREIPNPNRASIELQRQMRKAHEMNGNGNRMYVHAKAIEFDHPIDKRIEVSLECKTPF